MFIGRIGILRNYIFLLIADLQVAKTKIMDFKIQICAVTIAFSLITPLACTGSLSPNGEVCICLTQPQTFVCTVHGQSYSTRLEWRVDFKNSQSVSRVTQQFTTFDIEGETLNDERMGVNFTFNLTSISLTSLVSVMTVTTNNSAATVINNATVHCGDESTPHAVLHVRRGLQHSQRLLNFTHHGVVPQVTNFTNGTNTKIQWNQVDSVETFSIDFDPAINNKSTFTTTNNSIQVFLLYYQTYNIRVIANNCAGNSTPEEVNITLVPYCNFSNSSGHENVFESNISEPEAFQTKIYYRCTSNVSLSLDPTTLAPGGNHNPTMKIVVWHIVAGIVTLIVMFLIAVGVLASMLKVYKGKDQKRAAVDQHNHYSDIPTSGSNNQELGIYSVLQPEENTMKEHERPGPVYADIGCTLSLSANNANICQPLDADHVEYVAVKQLFEDSHSDNDSGVQTDIPVNLDNLLIHLRAHLTPKWKEFGVIVGIEEDVLKIYSGHPPGECIVEVLDYWLRNCQEGSKPTWKKIAYILKEIGLHQLAENIQYNDIGIIQPQEDTNYESEFDFQFVSSEEVPPPLPPKIVNLDEEMKIGSSSPSALEIEHQLGSRDVLQAMSSESSGNSYTMAPPIPPKNYI